MGGPMSDYRLGKIMHREYEAEASQYWGQGLGQTEGSNLAERVDLVLSWSGEGLRRLRCSATWLGVWAHGCESRR